MDALILSWLIYGAKILYIQTFIRIFFIIVYKETLCDHCVISQNRYLIVELSNEKVSREHLSLPRVLTLNSVVGLSHSRACSLAHLNLPVYLCPRAAQLGRKLPDSVAGAIALQPERGVSLWGSLLNFARGVKCDSLGSRAAPRPRAS